MQEETETTLRDDPEEPPKSGRVLRRILVIVGLALPLVIIGMILFYGYWARPGWIGVANKKFWDYLELLIVPGALAIGVAWLNWAQSKREREANEAQQEREREADEAQQERERQAQTAQRERELQVENQRAQDAALQAYLDHMSQLLTDKDLPLHRASPGDSLSSVASARTLTVLGRLDSDRKGYVVRFLYELNLITEKRSTSGTLLRGPIVKLKGADLRGIDLTASYLRDAVLGRYIIDANQAGPLIYPKTDLQNAKLTNTFLGGARLAEADLRGADLSGNELYGTDFYRADLRHANLQGALLEKADLREASLEDANLRHVAGITTEELEQQTWHLSGAIMPDGSTHP